jgi:hypothetical protein
MKATITGWEALTAWNKSAKMHHLPAWFKQKIKIRRKLEDRHDLLMPETALHSFSGWDHWGSVQFSYEMDRAVYSMPYGNCDEKMRDFAEKHCMHLTIEEKAPWHPSCRLYIFRKTNLAGNEAN